MINVNEAIEYIEKLKEYDINKGRDPSTWFMYHNHVYGVANVSKLIASRLDGISPERAFVLGLLHDVGRITERHEQRFHGVLGYEYLKDIDKEAARISMTHMFPLSYIDDYECVEKSFFGKKEDYDFVKQFLQDNPINQTDKIVQISDALANAYGVVTIQERNEEYMKRHKCSISEKILNNMCALKTQFDDLLGADLYDLMKYLPKDYMLPCQ